MENLTVSAAAGAPDFLEYAGFESSIEPSSYEGYISYFPDSFEEYEPYPDADLEGADLAAAAESPDKSSENSPDSNTSTAKRRRPNRYKNCSPEVLSRRRAQNRTSQRNYRQRKDQRIKELEDLLKSERSKHDVLSHAYSILQAEMEQLEADRRQWVYYEQGCSGQCPTDHAAMNQILYAGTAGHLIGAPATGHIY